MFQVLQPPLLQTGHHPVREQNQQQARDTTSTGAVFGENQQRGRKQKT